MTASRRTTPLKKGATNKRSRPASPTPAKKLARSRIFLVHGHDTSTLHIVARTIEITDGVKYFVDRNSSCYIQSPIIENAPELKKKIKELFNNTPRPVQ
jgi:hypothetical protein